MSEVKKTKKRPQSAGEGAKVGGKKAKFNKTSSSKASSKTSAKGADGEGKKRTGKKWNGTRYIGGKKVAIGSGANATLTKETAKSRRDRKLARKQKKPRYELTQQCKKLWEKLRIEKKELSKSSNYTLIDELLKVIKTKDNKLSDLIYAHDTSRIIQTCLKEGNEAQRQLIFDQLKDKVVDMSKNKYAKNILWKLVKYGTTEQRSAIMADFKGNVYQLVKKSNLSASVIEYVYNNFANQKQRHMFIRELCGKVYQLHPKSEELTFGQVLSETTDEEARKSLMSGFHQAILPLVEKQAIKHTILHKVFYEFFVNVDDAVLRSELIEAIRESLVHMVHTHDGAHTTMYCLWYGTKKDRKVILKTLKEFAVKLATEEFGYLALLAAFDCVDDTVFLKKAILSPILKKIEDISGDHYGMKLITYLMSPRNTSHFMPETIKLLQTGDGNPTSKKGMEQRHKELVETASPEIIKYFADNVDKMAFDRSGFLLIELAMLTLVNVQPLADAIVQLCVPQFTPGEKDKNGQFHIVESLSGHLMMKKIISGESKKCEDENTKASPVFSMALLNKIDGEKLTSWTSCNRGGHVLLALVNSKSKEVAGESRKLLLPHLHTIEENGAKSKSAKMLAEKLKEE